MRDIVYGSKKMVDKTGERIDFKEPYFDKALRRVFRSVDEKASFMNSRGLVSSGDYDSNTKREVKKVDEMKRAYGKDWQRHFAKEG
jgi:hypothetical protein